MTPVLHRKKPSRMQMQIHTARMCVNCLIIRISYIFEPKPNVCVWAHFQWLNCFPFCSVHFFSFIFINGHLTHSVRVLRTRTLLFLFNSLLICRSLISSSSSIIQNKQLCTIYIQAEWIRTSVADPIQLLFDKIKKNYNE